MTHDHAITHGRAAVAFIDLSGFTALTEAHGDRHAAELAEAFADLTRASLGDHDRLIKTIGDAVLVTSPTAHTMLALIGRITDATRRAGRFPVLRAGVHDGTIVTLGNDIYGATVNIAARLAAAAGPAQILATQPVADIARAAGLAATSLGPVTLRNLTEPLAVFSVDLGIGCPCGQVDPVCRMQLDHDTTTTSLTHHGITYRFCSATCARRFTAQPHQFTNAVSCSDTLPTR
ncbi:YHS domain-containing protein [Mycobacterium paragordonae]|uniref:adenylate/guanylate cyclase domain-containing protein n=1 Tax=Mycobacterium paragordonae TaxID=1389713 RepID=UPI00105CF0B1|nr:adenylate/guanylate cyclase domain-containing protein [Mycobacterium paragordonae]TDK85073.1 YHS domain-containing protein [Mycobacterium paragordonae]TDK96810.1 YHS domain-containing protein [Mycobacterium paragordonae]